MEPEKKTGPDTSLVVKRTDILPAPALTPQEWADRRRHFNEWVNSQLKKDVDYGVIPKTDKPTLLKPGAEKISQYYGCAPIPEISHREYDTATGYLYVECLMRLVSLGTGEVLGVGVGCCSSFESKYRYRNEWWDNCGDPPAGEGWERTRGGKWRRRVPNPDLIDTWNTVIKIAKKRALVDAALTISAASERFTQDLDEMEDAIEGEATEVGGPGPAPSKPTARTEGTGNRAKGASQPGHPWTSDPRARAKVHAFIASECERTGLAFPPKGPESAYERLKREQFHVEHLADFQGTAQEFKDGVIAWFNAEVERRRVQQPQEAVQ